MSKQQSGFTLIELVMVIVILGILAAVAVPKFVDLSTQASDAAVKGVAGGLSSAAATNYGAKVAGNTNAASVAECQNVSNAMVTFPSGYTITTTAVTLGSGVAKTDCVVTGTTSANFTAIGA